MPATIERGEAVYLSSLIPGSVLDVVTKHHRYRIEYLGGEEVKISGHPTICPTPVVARLLGSADDAGPVEAGFVRSGMHLVFRRVYEYLPVITTSAITDVRVNQPYSNPSSDAKE
jgi:hypothetical protein